MTLRRPSISPEEAACFLMTACAQQAGVAPARVSVAELPPTQALGGHAPRCLSAASAPPGAGCLARRSGWPGVPTASLWVDGATARLRALGVCAPVSAELLLDVCHTTAAASVHTALPATLRPLVSALQPPRAGPGPPAVPGPLGRAPLSFFQAREGPPRACSLLSS